MPPCTKLRVVPASTRTDQRLDENRDRTTTTNRNCAAYVPEERARLGQATEGGKHFRDAPREDDEGQRGVRL